MLLAREIESLPPMWSSGGALLCFIITRPIKDKAFIWETLPLLDMIFHAFVRTLVLHLPDKIPNTTEKSKREIHFKAWTHKYIWKWCGRFYQLNTNFGMAFILKSGADILEKCDSNPLPLSDRLTELLWLQDKFGVFCIFATSAFNGKTRFSEGQLYLQILSGL